MRRMCGVMLVSLAALLALINYAWAAQHNAEMNTVADLQAFFDQVYTNEEQAILYPVFSTDAVFQITLGATSFASTNFQNWITNGWPSLEVASGITGYPVFFEEQVVSNERVRIFSGLNGFPLLCWTNNWDVNSWIQSAYGEVPYWENAETWRALRDPSHLHYSISLIPAELYEQWLELVTPTSVAYVVNNEVPTEYTNSLFIVDCPGQRPPFRLYMPPGKTNADIFSTMELVPTDWALKNTLYNPGPYSQLFINESLAHEYLQAADADIDSDGDGLSDAREDLIYGTRNDLADTDGDGIPDGVEILSFGLDPLDPDCDDDGLYDGVEIYVYGTGPKNADSDGDGLTDGNDPDPLSGNINPVVRLGHPNDNQVFEGPTYIDLTSDAYSTGDLRQITYRVEALDRAYTHEETISPSSSNKWRWTWALPGNYRIKTYGTDYSGKQGETNVIDIVVTECSEFTALSPSARQLFYTEQTNRAESVPESVYGPSVTNRSGQTPGGDETAPSSIAALFLSASEYTVLDLGACNRPHIEWYAKIGDRSYGLPDEPDEFDASIYGRWRWGAMLETDIAGGFPVLPAVAFPEDPELEVVYPPVTYWLAVYGLNEKQDWVGAIFHVVGPGYPYSGAKARLMEIYNRQQSMRPYKYSNGTWAQLKTPPPYNTSWDDGVGLGINSKGDAVGAVLDVWRNDEVPPGYYGDPPDWQPMLFRDGCTGTVMELSGNAKGGIAYAINNDSTAVGSEFLLDGTVRAVKWVDGHMIPIPGLEEVDGSAAYNISDDGAIVGVVENNGTCYPFITRSGTDTILCTNSYGGLTFSEFWHIDRYGVLGCGVNASGNGRVGMIIPDDDQDGMSDIFELEMIDYDPQDDLENLVDVTSADDYDGDTLVNSNEYYLRTDPVNPDSDGDHLFDGLDPSPLIHKDTDGDGMSDDWETYYSLAPDSAAGINGWEGNYDGDDFPNGVEYLLGSNPASSASTPPYVFNYSQIGTLRVDLETSANCGGNQASAQQKSQTIQLVEQTATNVPPLEFIFEVTVEGSVEREDSGYDRVSVNGVTAFSGSGDGLGCEMDVKTETIHVPVLSPNGHLTLTYDTGDGLFHESPYAEVQSVTLYDVNYDRQALTNYIIKVDTIEPDYMANLEEVDDGDGNPKTRIFVVPIAAQMEFPVDPVTVHATITPNLSESELPSGWNLQGGTGSEKLTRTVSRRISSGPSKTEFTFSFGGTDSGFKTTIYVYDARVALFADNGGLNSPEVGHSWGRYTLDAYATDLVSPNERQYLQEMGFFPAEPSDWVQILLGNSVLGDFCLGAAAYGSHYPSGYKEYPAQFSALSLDLAQVDAVHSEPPPKK